MTNTAEKMDTAPNPLVTLSDDFKSDMDAVNAMILEKMDSPVALIPQLASYLIAAGGKRVRPLLTLASTAIFDGDMTRAHRLASAVEFIHTATLLHDDVVDESEERRGKQAANLVFGNQASVLVGDFLFSRAFQLMTEDGSIDVLRILSGASAIIAEGEVMQLTTANNLDTTMDEYIQVIDSKTAALFAAACEVGPVIADATDEQAKALADYGRYMGIAFQIADDTLDYMAEREKLGKAVGDDFREGKMTAPVLFALQNAKEKNNTHELEFWTRTLKDLNQSEGDLEKAQDILTQNRIIEQCFNLANSYKDKAIQALTPAPDGDIKQTLENIAEYTVTRQS